MKECKCANYQFLHFPDSFTYENYMDHYENIAAYIFDECDDPAEKFCYKGFEGDDHYDSYITKFLQFSLTVVLMVQLRITRRKCKCRNYDTSGESFHYII